MYGSEISSVVMCQERRDLVAELERGREGIEGGKK